MAATHSCPAEQSSGGLQRQSLCGAGALRASPLNAPCRVRLQIASVLPTRNAGGSKFAQACEKDLSGLVCEQQHLCAHVAVFSECGNLAYLAKCITVPSAFVRSPGRTPAGQLPIYFWSWIIVISLMPAIAGVYVAWVSEWVEVSPPKVVVPLLSITVAPTVQCISMEY